MHTWSDLEKMFRCEGNDRLVHKIIKAAEYRECAIEESQEKVAKLNALGFASPKKRLPIVRGKESEIKEHQVNKGPEKIRVERNSVMKNSIQGANPEVQANTSGNFTSR